MLISIMHYLPHVANEETKAYSDITIMLRKVRQLSFRKKPRLRSQKAFTVTKLCPSLRARPWESRFSI